MMHSPNTQVALQRATFDYPVPTEEPVPPVRESIAARAYELWLEEGQPPDAAERNWLQAEAELNATDLQLP